MKRYLFLLLCSLFACVISFAQTNYYTETKVFNETDYIYQCEIDPTDFVVLYNKDYKLTPDDVKFKSTGKTFIPDNEDLDLITHESWLTFRRKFYSIIQNAFSESEKNILKLTPYEIYVDLYFNTETGKVDEVKFSFYKNSAFVFVPVSVYRNMEVQIKRACQFIITEEGKRLNYIYYWDTYKFE